MQLVKAALVLLQLFINGNENFHTTDNLQRKSGTLFSNVNNEGYTK